MDDVLQRGDYESPLGYDNVHWFVAEVVKLEIKMSFLFKNTSKDILMTEKDGKFQRNNNICRVCEKK